MPRTGKRITIARGIYRDGPNGPYEIRVTVGGESFLARMPADSTPDELKARRVALELQGRTEAAPVCKRGTLAGDAPRYINLMKHLESWKDREAHLKAWIARHGSLPRHRITSAHILTARIAWLDEGRSPKTINHRVNTLRHLYRVLDGKRARTPCDDLEPLPVPKTPIQRVSNDLLLAVDQKLQTMEGRRVGRPMSAKTRARFRVFVSTGKRPCEIMRAEPGDVDLDARVWVPRDAKGGFCPGVFLNDDQRAAWQLFIHAKAWGPYSTGAFARTLRSAGWPEGLRPYQARHTTWITASERGIDLEDIAVGAGHRDSRTTRRAYVPVLNSRLQRLGEVLEGRFKGWPVVPDDGTARKRRA